MSAVAAVRMIVKVAAVVGIQAVVVVQNRVIPVAVAPLSRMQARRWFPTRPPLRVRMVGGPGRSDLFVCAGQGQISP